MEKKKNSGPLIKNPFFLGCIVPPSLLIILCVILAVIFYPRLTTEKPDFITEAEPVVEKKLSELDLKETLLKENKYQYDIDQTVTALFSIEKAISEAKNFQDLTELIVQNDSDLVAPDVSKLKVRIFDVYKDVLDSRDKLEEMDSIYKATMGSVTDLVGLLGADIGSGITLDRDQVKKIWEKRLIESKSRDKIQERLRKSQDKLLDILFDFAKISVKYTKEWDKLCTARDRAYLAFYERDWDELISSAQIAVEISPTESEAHTLLALGLLERGKELDFSAANGIIGKLLENKGGQQAPAYLLRGVVLMKKGDYDNAIIDFDQAATYYPKQQEEVTDKLNLYKKRSFLNKSKEGRVIINTYRGIMSGSGYFSPDFQKARIHLARKETSKAKEKTFDHFFRRRLQGQWDKVLTDFQFCRNFLDTDLYEIITDEKIDLMIEPSWIGNSIVVTVNNRSGKDIHNASVLLCVRFTDMFRGDYISFPFGSSVAVIPAGQSVNFGRENISDATKESLGTVKKWKDIIEYGSVLISDEIITWTAPVTNSNMAADDDKKEAKQEIKNTTDKAKEVLDDVISGIIDSVSDGKNDAGK